MPVKPTLRTIPVAKIEPDPNQPRKKLTEEELEELAASMKQLGQLQPVAVRKTTTSGLYRLVVGERRWRAARLGGIEHLAAMVWDLDDQAVLIAQVAENINRQDMTPMEEAAAYRRLTDAGMEPLAVAELFGKSEPYIGWRIDLLSLIPEAQDVVAKGHLPVSVAWYASRLSPDQQHRFLVRWARGEFRSARDAEAFAQACRTVEDQQSMLDLDESEHTEEEREAVVNGRKKVVSKIERLATAGEVLYDLAQMDPVELARVLAGADGGIGAYRKRVDDLKTLAGKVSAKLRKAQALAAAVEVQLNPEILPEAPAEALEPSPVS